MNEKTIYALGFFDGVHLGHQTLLRACRELAQKHGCKAGVVTFTSHPDALVSGNAPALLNTIEDRRQLLHAYGMDTVTVLPFDRTLMHTHWSAFLTQLAQTGAAGFVCGSDFRFGAGGRGTSKKLAAYCERRQLPYAVVPQQLLDGIRVSSTHIRGLLEQGKTEDALRFLGHPHILTGTVVPGQHLGRTMGIPTANLAFPSELVQPRLGVYACTAHVDGSTYVAVTNIGSRPTVGGDHITVEPWLLDFEGDLYGKTVTVSLHKFLRPEQKFPTLDALKAQIQLDAADASRLLG